VNIHAESGGITPRTKLSEETVDFMQKVGVK